MGTFLRHSVYIISLKVFCVFLSRQGAVPGRTDGRQGVYSGAVPAWAASGSAEWCAGLASARSARRLPAANPGDAAAVITVTRDYT